MSELDMPYEWQSEARIWVDLGSTEAKQFTEPLKLTITEAADLYQSLGSALREYVGRTEFIQKRLTDEIDFYAQTSQ